MTSRCPRPLLLDCARMPSPLFLPPAPRPLPLGRRGHRFPRSHGPPERKVRATWLTLRCRADLSPETAPWSGSGPRAASEVEMPNEPERRRNRREIATMTCQASRRAAESVLAPVRADPAPRKPMPTEKPKEPERRRNPGEFGSSFRKANLLAEAQTMLGRSPCPNAAPLRRKYASEGPKEPKSRRNPRGVPTTTRPTNPASKKAGPYRRGPEFAEMRQGEGRSGIGVGGR